MFRRPRWVAGLAAIALAAASMAAVVGWVPAAAEPSVEVFAPEPTPGAKARCAECGVIVSKREIDNSSAEASPKLSLNSSRKSSPNSSRRYEIIVRMGDGSSRVIDDVRPANWRVGERLTFIDGVKPPTQ